MAIPVVYLRTLSAAPVLLRVRLHNRWDRMGDVKGSRLYPAEMENLAPRAVFDLDAIPTAQITKGAILSFEQGEAYTIDHTLPPDDRFQHVQIAPMINGAANGLPYPSEDGDQIVYPGNGV